MILTVKISYKIIICLIALPSEDNLLALGGYDHTVDGYGLSNVEGIGIQNDLNCNPTDLPNISWGQSTVASDLGLISCGGHDGTGRVSKCILQQKNGSTTSFPSMNLPRIGFNLVIVGDVIFAIGGAPTSGNNAPTTMEKINIKTDNAWTQQDLGFEFKWGCTTSVGNNKIVAIGGCCVSK